MALEIAPLVTLEDVERKLAQFQRVYGISIADWESDSELQSEYEDAADELRFLNSQKEALLEACVRAFLGRIQT